MNNVYYAYLAGLVDGDGCVTVAVRKDYNTVRGISFCMSVKVASTNKDHMEFLKKNFDGSVGLTCSAKGRKRAVYQWALSGNRAMELLTKMIPYMLNRKIQAQLAVQFQKRIGEWSSQPYPDIEYEKRIEIVSAIRSLNAKKDMYIKDGDMSEVLEESAEV